MVTHQRTGAARRTWEQNAAEFQVLTKQGVDVRLAVLVACSVDGTSKGGRPETGANTPVSAKASATDFAKAAGTTKDRVMRHLKAWNACAKDGLCLASEFLTPAQAIDPDLRVPSQDDFAKRFDASQSGGRPRASVQEVVERAKKDPDYADKVARGVNPHTTGARASKDFETKVRQSRTKGERQGELPQLLIDLETVRFALRRAVHTYERNPHVHEDWAGDVEVALIEVQHLVGLLVGKTEEWTNEDRDFLAALGVEDER